MSSPAATRNRADRSASKPANFDRVARLYRWAEYACLGPLLDRTRRHFVPQLRNARRALVLGDGDGRFLAYFLEQVPSVHALAVDTSAGMLHLLQARCAFAADRLTTLRASVEELPAKTQVRDVDLIVTHFLLDCLPQEEVDGLADYLGRTVSPGSKWVVSEFDLPSKQPWRALAWLYIRGLYFAFRWLTGLKTQSLPNISAALHKAGFHRIHRSERLQGLLYSELWQLGPGSLRFDNAALCATSPSPESSTLS